MRDPERIQKTLKLLKKYWTKYPDLRLAQIICNMSPQADPYFMEDEFLIEEIRKELNNVNNRHK